MPNTHTTPSNDVDSRDLQRDGKHAPAHNKAGRQAPTPRNEARRTTESRNDREGHVGGSNQIQSRRGATR